MFLFPKWTNRLPLLIAVSGAVTTVILALVIWYYFAAKNTDVGYQPKQPVQYSHALHVGELGLDCRYCHLGVESSAHAMVPSAETCMNCHRIVLTNSPEIKKVRTSYENNKPIAWNKVHLLPDYVYFNHSAHINAGVSCVSCHGRVDQMVKVSQREPLSMSWCLECHRSPEEHVRPKDKVTKLHWQATNQKALGQKLIEAHGIAPKQDCNTCHF